MTGKIDEATKAFSAAATTASNNISIKSEAAFGAARLLAKQGKTAAALEEIQNLEAAKDAQNNMSPYIADAAALKIAIENGEYGKIK